MATKFCKWPPENLAGAEAYKAEADARYEEFLEDNNAPEPGAIWGLIRLDKNGNHTIPLFGPPWKWDGINEVPEPPSCLALRADAVVVDTPEWPVEEE